MMFYDYNLLETLNSEDFRQIEELIDPKLFKNFIPDDPPTSGDSGLPLQQQPQQQQQQPHNVGGHYPHHDGGVPPPRGDVVGATGPLDNLKGSPQRVPPSTHPGPPTTHPGPPPGYVANQGGHSTAQHMVPGQHLSQQHAPNKNFQHTQFPESPPDSGSEPYSPPNEQHGRQPPTQDPPSCNVKTNGISSLPQYHPNVHGPPTGPPHPQTAVTGSHQHHNNSSPPHQQSPPHMTVPVQMPSGSGIPTCGIPGTGIAGPGRAVPYIYSGPEPPKLQHHNASMPLNVQALPNPISSMNNLANQAPKKRKHSDSPNSTINQHILNQMAAGMPPGLLIKQEPGNHGLLGDCDEEYNYDLQQDPTMFMEGSFQVIKWQPYQQNKWGTLLDELGKELPPINYRVDADKGFNYSPQDEAFVCQKKNHFQVTVHMGLSGSPKYIRNTEGNVRAIEHFELHFHGIKAESTSQMIRVEQSQADRTKKPFHPVKLELSPDQVNKYTVGRMHFSETTSNNMRKKGKPNPDQRYFMLVVALQARHRDETSLLAAHMSERIIVRASNPGQFDSEADIQWSKGRTPDSVVHLGRVGINNENPDAALDVHGNIRLTGQLIQPSDKRVKTQFQEIDPKQQLKNISQLKVYRYAYQDQFADYAGMSDEDKDNTGIIAQEVKEVMPDAVKDTGDVTLPNGETINNFLVVNKDRIFYENIGAVKALCTVTNTLENRITQIEGLNDKLQKKPVKRDSVKSTTSTYSYSTCSTISRTSSLPPSEKISDKKSSNPLDIKHNDNNNTRNNHSSSRCHHHSNNHHHRRHHRRHSGSGRGSVPPPNVGETGPCNNKLIQIIVIILVLVMAFCLVAITTLYVLEKQKKDNFYNYFTTTPAPNSSMVNMTTPVTPPSEEDKGNDTNFTTIPSLPAPSANQTMLTPPHCLQSTCEVVCCRSTMMSTTMVPSFKPPNDPGKGSIPKEKKPNQINPDGKGGTTTDPPYHVIPGGNALMPAINATKEARAQLQPGQEKYMPEQDDYGADVAGGAHAAYESVDVHRLPVTERPNDTKIPYRPAVMDTNELDPSANQIADDPDVMDDDYEIADDEIAKVPRVVVVDTNNHHHRRLRNKRDVNMQTFHSELLITQINKTIDSIYCTNDNCRYGNGNNYTYKIPISPVFPLAFVTINFIMHHDPSSLDVLLCLEQEMNRCDQGSDSDAKINATRGLEHHWDLPIGFYFNSHFKFRIANKDTIDVCKKPESEAGYTFSEYNLEFHRVCDGIS